MSIVHHSRSWTEYEQNCEQPPFQIGQRVRHLSASANLALQVVTWVSPSATRRADQLISTNRNSFVPAAIFVIADVQQQSGPSP